MSVNVNCISFFEKYNSDPQLRERIAEAEAMYPGSLENRESVAAEVLLPVAAELGLPFTVEELRAYETRMLLEERTGECEGIPEERVYWLLNHGWTYDETEFCGG